MRLPSTVDVAIVGAGAAGLAAAKRCHELGKEFVVLEAMDRVGGRAYTDFESFGFAWDLGCHWLHSADVNPFTGIADQLGFKYETRQPSYRVHLGDRWASDAEAADAFAYVEANVEAIQLAGSEGQDRPATDLIDFDSPWLPMLRTSLGAEWSVDLPDISSLDDSNYSDTNKNWPVIDGYGALVARNAAGVPVSLSTPVRAIRWGGTDVRVETDSGAVIAKQVIVTVSVKALQDERIEFDPPLPGWKLAAIDAIQLGNANKVAFAVDRRALGITDYTVIHAPLDDRQGIWIRPGVYGRNLVDCYLAGESGAELEAQGPVAMIDAVLGVLTSVFGSDLSKLVTGSACSLWQSEPWIGGAYGMARPGYAHLRPQLATPIDDRLYFAGEATSPTFYTTCHGAHQTGIAAAESIDKGG